MPATSNFTIISAKLKRLPAALRPAIMRGMKRGLELTSAMVQREYMSGPRPSRLDVVTTRLRNSIATSVQDDGQEIVGRIGTNVVYGAYHEFGFHGTQQVRAHTRVLSEITAKGETTDSRRRIRDLRGNIIGYKDSRSRAAARAGNATSITMVRAHSRQVDYRGRPFVKPALVRCQGMIANEVHKELQRAVARESQGNSLS